METMLTRLPAHDNDTEEAILSALMLDNSVFDDIGQLTPQDFYNRSNQKIFAAILDLFRKDDPVDIVTVVTTLKTMGELDSVGGYSHVSYIADAAPMAINAGAYASTIKSLSLNRRVLNVAVKIQDAALKGETGDAVLEMLQSEAMKIQSSDKKDTIFSVKDLILDHIDVIEKANVSKDGRGYPLGFPGIDNCLSVMGPKFILIAGRPKMGKTSLAVTIMRNMDKLGIKTGILSIEMPKSEVLDKWLAQESQVDSQKFGQYKGLSPDDFQAISDAAGRMSESCNILIDDSGSIGIDDVKRKSRKMVKDGVKVLFIDQLSQIKGRPGQDRFTTYAENCSEIAALKKELGIPIFLLAQLNRKLEERSNKEPIPSDLKMTGNLEEDCDACIFVYRPEIYAQGEAEAEALKGKAVINLALNRHGSPWRDNRIIFKPETSYFYQGE